MRFRWIANIEKAPAAQKFLRATGGAETLLLDEAAGSAAVLAGKRCDLAIAGIICGAMSSLNGRRAENSQCIETRTAGTGQTFGYLKDYISSAQVPLLVIENTSRLDKPVDWSDLERGSPFLTAVAELADEGYSCMRRHLTAAPCVPKLRATSGPSLGTVTRRSTVQAGPARRTQFSVFRISPVQS